MLLWLKVWSWITLSIQGPIFLLLLHHSWGSYPSCYPRQPSPYPHFMHQAGKKNKRRTYPLCYRQNLKAAHLTNPTGRTNHELLLTARDTRRSCKSLFWAIHFAKNSTNMEKETGYWRNRQCCWWGNTAQIQVFLCHVEIQIHYCLIRITLVWKGQNLRFLPIEQFHFFLKGNFKILPQSGKKSQNKKSKTLCRSYKTYIPADHDHYFGIQSINY